MREEQREKDKQFKGANPNLRDNQKIETNFIQHRDEEITNQF